MDGRDQKLARGPPQQAVDVSDPPPPYNDTLATPQSTANNVPSSSTQRGPPGYVSTTRTNPSQPIAIPAVTKKIGSAFLRSYPPVLKQYDISSEDFLAFLDHFNRVTVKSPPLQVMGLAGTIISFVPVHSLNLIGAGINAAAEISSRAISKGTTELCLRRANRDLFGPKGLKVEIARLDALAKIASIPILNAEGEIGKKSEILIPLENIRSQDLEVPSVQQRRIDALKGYIQPLEMQELPDLDKGSNLLSKWHSVTSRWEAKNGEKKVTRKRERAQRKLERREAKADRKLEKRLSKIQGKHGSGFMRDENGTLLRPEGREAQRNKLYEGNDAAIAAREKAEYRRQKRQAKLEGKISHSKREEKEMRLSVWLVIRPVAADSGKGENPDVGEDFSVSEEDSDTDLDDSDEYEMNTAHHSHEQMTGQEGAIGKMKIKE